MRLALILVLSTTVIGCQAQLSRAECALDAVKALPDDPEQATVADAKDVIQRLTACRSSVDAGAP